MGKKYRGSFADVKVGKTATFGFKEKKFKTLEEFAHACLRQAWIPVRVERGHRTYDAVTKIHNWLRFDCDVRGEMETITSVLDSRGLEYMCLPSTNYDPKSKNYKWHISVPVEGVAKDVVQYKWQMKRVLTDLGIDLHDRRVTEVCVQNMNPYQNGHKPVKGEDFIKIHKGQTLQLTKPPKDISYSEMTKTTFNGKGANDVIPKKVVYATERLEVLSPDSGIKIDGIGWVALKDLNLDVGSMIGGLSCPSHNTKHNNGKGGHQTGYAFATMNEGGDVWVTCTGAECQGRSYKVDYDDFGANTKLSDLYDLRRIVSLSAFNFDKNSIFHVKANGDSVMFRWKDVFNYWSKELFWKLPMDLSEDNNIKINKLIKKKKKHQGNIGLIVDLDKKIAEVKLENEYEIIGSALNNETQFDMFKAKYTPTESDGVMTMPHEKYIAEIVEKVGTYITVNKQHSVVAYEIDPFIVETKGRVVGNEFIITTNQLLPKQLRGKPSKRIVDDYKEHNPFLDDILNMIMAQRYGADKKSSYLWLQADSDWGKSFLFEGMLKGLGYPMSETEIKNALKGTASGIDVDKMIKCSFVFVDEFKGAVSELKNIATEMSVTQKFKSKTVVPMYMKIFASAEQVQSLSGSIGMEAQFANRFLYMKVEGSLLKRPLYNKDMDEYKRTITLYINQELHRLKAMYDNRGRYGAIKLANDVFSKLKVTHTIKNTTESTTDILPTMFRDWLVIIKEREAMLDGSIYKDCLFYVKGKLHIINIAKAKEVFIYEALDKASGNIARHKSNNDIMGSIARSSIKLNGVKRNTFVIS